MVFSTLTFLFGFLPALLVLYFIVPKRLIWLRNVILLIFSVFFYAWGVPVYVFLLLLCIGLTYIVSRAISRKNRAALVLGLLINLLPLFFFKYASFIMLNFSNITGIQVAVPSISLPVGISFYTFHMLTYIIDLYRGRVEIQRNPAYLALYVFLFPQLVAGPIVRYYQVEKQIRSRETNWEDCYYGARRFILGLAKKVLIANQAGYVVTTIRQLDSSNVNTLLLWICVLSYGVQIYFDFSGYSDMAIGLGRIFGFHLPENFNKPYISRSITDFWHRWHISLSTFFRDYVYIPMGGSRVSPVRHIFNLFIVWFLTGLWHGAYWNYVLWGLYYFILLVLEKYVYGKALDKLPAVISRFITFTLVMFGWALFMFESNSIIEIGNNIARLFGFYSASSVPSIRALSLQGHIIITAIGLILGILTKPGFIKRFESKYINTSSVIKILVLLLLFALSIMFIIDGSYNPFIYFRF